MKIALIGNYLPDQQESMTRYAELLLRCLVEAGLDVNLVLQRQNLPWAGATGPGRLFGYVDKYLLGLPKLLRARNSVDLVHICDHSNAVYVPRRSSVPYTVTCHDLLAVRGALGEVEDCPASFTGRFLQRAILSGLGRARGVACVSEATARDFRRLLPSFSGPIPLIPNALAFDYRRLTPTEQHQSIGSALDLTLGQTPFLLHVGSNAVRKNRDMLIKTLAALQGSWKGNVVLAGQPMSEFEHQLASSLGVSRRIIEITGASNEQLCGLYNRAHCLLFPSRWEGFGWPLIEAQASGCPVLCSDRDPMPEVTGGAALFCPPDDAKAFANGVLFLDSNLETRLSLITKGLDNSDKFTRTGMAAAMVRFFESVMRIRVGACPA